jgi:hypothetical protein
MFSVFTSLILGTDLTPWRFFSFRGHAVTRWLTIHFGTHSAIFSVSSCRAQLSTECSLGTPELDYSQQNSSLSPLCTERIENTVPNNTPIVVFSDLLLRNGCFYSCVLVHFRRNLLTESLLSNERLLGLRYSGFQASCQFSPTRGGSHKICLQTYVQVGINNKVVKNFRIRDRILNTFKAFNFWYSYLHLFPL